MRRQRLELISQFCSLFEEYPCIKGYYNSLTFDSSEQRQQYCEQDMEYRHYEDSVRGCEQLWQDVLSCALQRDYSCPCSFILCEWTMPGSRTSPPSACDEENRILNECLRGSPESEEIEITGEHTTCGAYTSTNKKESECWIGCPKFSIATLYGAKCEEPTQWPMSCQCQINGTDIYDIYRYTLHPRLPEWIVSSCREAVQDMADGKCFETTNCCFTWTDSVGNESCACTADPTYSEKDGVTTCEELADAIGGRVVDLCPKHSYYLENETPP